MQLALMTWTEVEEYLKSKKSLILPVGSTEQHGPTGLIGTDYLSSDAIAKAVGERTKTLVAPPICYGMALHHMAFPGSAALKPSTYIQCVKEVLESFILHGFHKVFVINGHGGNIPSLNAVFSEILNSHQETEFKLINWWHLPSVTSYEKDHFGDKNGFHATCGEVAVTMHTHPEGFQKSRELKYFATPEKYPWPLSPKQFRAIFPDGRMGSDPRLSTPDHGQHIFKRAVSEICDILS